MKNRLYTWRPDLPDQRDHVYHPTVAPTPSVSALPRPPIKDQGPIGSCTGESATGMIETVDIKRGAYVALSAEFYYYQERVFEHTVRSDSGAQIRDGIKQAAKVGVCTEVLWPYLPARLKRRPSKAAYTDAATRKITEYMRLSTVDEMRSCLTEGFPFTFGFTVYESFESDEVARTGVVPMPGHSEKVLGGHAVYAVGYDPQYLLCVNSWGAGWGQQGLFQLPWAYLADRNLSDDFWTIRRG